VFIEDCEACAGSFSSVELGVADGGDGFAEISDSLKDLCARCLGCLVATELLCLAVGEEFGLGGEAEEIVVGGEQFLGEAGAEAVVQGVYQVERWMAGDEFEGLWGSFFLGRHFAF
jgi:hypothetical protein